eukprot:490384-Pelagomonas_calceolata.AAC.1
MGRPYCSMYLGCSQGMVSYSNAPHKYEYPSLQPEMHQNAASPGQTKNRKVVSMCLGARLPHGKGLSSSRQALMPFGQNKGRPLPHYTEWSQCWKCNSGCI